MLEVLADPTHPSRAERADPLRDAGMGSRGPWAGPGRDSLPGVCFTLHPALDAVSAALADVTKFLDVHMDNFAGPGVFVSAGPVPATDLDLGGQVGEPQWRAEVAGQDAMDRRDV